jgi:hypothetical protein
LPDHVPSFAGEFPLWQNHCATGAGSFAEAFLVPPWSESTLLKVNCCFLVAFLHINHKAGIAQRIKDLAEAYRVSPEISRHLHFEEGFISYSRGLDPHKSCSGGTQVLFGIGAQEFPISSALIR